MLLAYLCFPLLRTWCTLLVVLWTPYLLIPTDVYVCHIPDLHLYLTAPISFHWSKSCRIHQLHLCRGVRPSQRVSCYDTKQSDYGAPVMLRLWGMRSTPSSPSLPGLLLPTVVAPDRVLSMGQIELNCVG